MTAYSQPSPGFSRFLLTLLVLAALAVAVLWFIGHRAREGGGDLFPATAGGTGASASSTAKVTASSASSDLSKAGTAASSALSKAGSAASTALSETSADIKAAVDKQKQQNAAHGDRGS